MSLSLSNEVMLETLELSKRILEKWVKQVEQGIPGKDLPSNSDTAVEDFLQEMCGELALVSGKLERMASILAGGV